MIPFLVSIGPARISSYGVMAVLAFFLGTFVFWKRSREEYFPEDEVVDLVLVSLLWAEILGRVLYIAINFGDFGLNFYYWIAIWKFPGSIWEGALIGGLVSFIKIGTKKKWNVFKSLDLASIGLSLAHGLMSLGLFLSGSGIGKTTSLFWGMIVAGSFEKRHPVNLYSSIIWFGVFMFLWWVEGKYRRFVWYQKSKGDAKPGFLFFCYLITIGLAGLIYETFSESQVFFWGINIEVVVRLVVLLTGVVGLYLRSGLSVKTGADELMNKISSDWIRLGRRREKPIFK